MVFKRLHLGTVSYGTDTMDEIQNHLVNAYAQVSGPSRQASPCQCAQCCCGHRAWHRLSCNAAPSLAMPLRGCAHHSLINQETV